MSDEGKDVVAWGGVGDKGISTFYWKRCMRNSDFLDEAVIIR